MQIVLLLIIIIIITIIIIINYSYYYLNENVAAIFKLKNKHILWYEMLFREFWNVLITLLKY